MNLGNTWGQGAGWTRVIELIEVAKQPDGEAWTAERRDRIFNQVMARAQHEREQRRVIRAFAAGVSAMLVAGVLLRLIG